MGNFEKLSVLVIVVIIVMILVVALYTWQDNGDDSTSLDATQGGEAGNQTALNDPDNESGNESGNSPLEIPWPDPLPERSPAPEDLVDQPSVDPVDDLVPPFRDEPVTVEEPVVPATPGEVPVAPAESDEPWMYTIQQGDTLSHIAERELGTIRRMKEIMNLNPDLDPLKIRAGDQIKMPPRGRLSSTREAPDAASAGTSSAASRGGTIPTGDYYEIKAGDRLQTIAKRAYGSMDRWPELWARNLSSIPSIDDDLTPGTRIFIPK